MRLLMPILCPPPEARLDPGGDIVFPDRCAKCGRPEPDAWVTIRVARPNPLRLLAGLGGGKGYAWHVPHCAGCARTTRTRSALAHFGGFAFFLACIFVALIISSALLPRPWSTLAALPIVLVFVMPACFWGVYFPAPVAVHVDSGDAVFTIKDADYAVEFRALNGFAADAPREDAS